MREWHALSVLSKSSSIVLASLVAKLFYTLFTPQWWYFFVVADIISWIGTQVAVHYYLRSLMAQNRPQKNTGYKR